MFPPISSEPDASAVTADRDASVALLDPELAATLEFAPFFPVDADNLQSLRAMLTAGAAAFAAPDDGVRRDEVLIAGPDGAADIRLVIWTPPNLEKPAPALLMIHGGGYVLGSPEMIAGAARRYATQCGCIVVTPAYRLAPEANWPAPVDDCFAALAWLAAEAERLGIDRARIAIGGESAGGGLAAALAIRARDAGGPAIVFQLLVYPMLDDRTRPHPLRGALVWPHASNVFGWRSLLGTEPGSDAVPSAAVPARVSDLSGLPPAFIGVGALDLFADEDIDYARRLIASGVPTDLVVVAGAYHGFDLAVPDAAVSREFTGSLHRALRRAFGRIG